MPSSTPPLSPVQQKALAMFLDLGRVPLDKIQMRTGQVLVSRGLVKCNETSWTLTPKGREFLTSIEPNGQADEPIEHERETASADDDTTEWLDEPPGKRAHNAKPEPTFLKKRPGKWAEVFRAPKKSTANSAAGAFRKMYPAYRFAYRTIDGKFLVYGTYRGDEDAT